MTRQNEGGLDKIAEGEKVARKTKALKAKASKTDLAELLQIMMMKAYIVADEKASSSGGASSSSEPWTPANPAEALQVVQEAVNEKQSKEVANFAQELLRNASSG